MKLHLIMTNLLELLQVHQLMCTELLKLVGGVSRVLPKIEAARPRSTSGIQALCSLNNAIDKAKQILQYCGESSKLYLVRVLLE